MRVGEHGCVTVPTSVKLPLCFWSIQSLGTGYYKCETVVLVMSSSSFAGELGCGVWSACTKVAGAVC